MKKNTITGTSADEIEPRVQWRMEDTLPGDDYNNLAVLAAHAVGAPYSFIAIFNDDKWQIKGTSGISFSECTAHKYIISKLLRERSLSIPDTDNEPDLLAEPFLPQFPGIKSIAAVSLLTKQNNLYGGFFIADNSPRTLSHNQFTILNMLCSQASALLHLENKVTELEQHEARSYDSSEAHINTIFQNSIDAVIVTDDTGRILQWNPQAEAMFGWKPEDIAASLFQEAIVHPGSHDAYREAMAHYGITGTGTTTNKIIELSALRSDNDTFDIALGITPTTIKGERYFLNFISDITDRKQASQRLDEQKEFYENILNQLPTDIAVFDANHKYLFVNPGAISDPELRKYIVGKDDYQYAEYRKRDRSVADIRREQFMQVKNSGVEIRWEDTVKDPRGNPITHLRRLFPVHDENGALTLVIGFGIDITERKLMEVKQTEFLKQLSAQNTQLIDFCNIVSHNLRAPLVNMSMLVDFIQESTDLAEQEMLVTKLKPVLDNLHVTFNELVESIQIKQDLEIKSEKNNLEQVLERTIEGLKTEISKSNAIIEFDFEKAPVIDCPSKYLFSIFHNLVSNSLKYQSPKRVPVIKLETVKENGKIIFSVNDNGLGIDLVKHKDNIFKIGKVFHRHPNAKGFGLFMTKTHVEAMDGQIWAESVPGEGSTFYIEFKNQK